MTRSEVVERSRCVVIRKAHSCQRCVVLKDRIGCLHERSMECILSEALDNVVQLKFSGIH